MPTRYDMTGENPTDIQKCLDWLFNYYHQPSADACDGVCISVVFGSGRRLRAWGDELEAKNVSSPGCFRSKRWWQRKASDPRQRLLPFLRYQPLQLRSISRCGTTYELEFKEHAASGARNLTLFFSRDSMQSDNTLIQAIRIHDVPPQVADGGPLFAARAEQPQNRSRPRSPAPVMADSFRGRFSSQEYEVMEDLSPVAEQSEQPVWTECRVEPEPSPSEPPPSEPPLDVEYPAQPRTSRPRARRPNSHAVAVAWDGALQNILAQDARAPGAGGQAPARPDAEDVAHALGFAPYHVSANAASRSRQQSRYGSYTVEPTCGVPARDESAQHRPDYGSGRVVMDFIATLMQYQPQHIRNDIMDILNNGGDLIPYCTALVVSALEGCGINISPDQCVWNTYGELIGVDYRRSFTGYVSMTLLCGIRRTFDLRPDTTILATATNLLDRAPAAQSEDSEACVTWAECNWNHDD